MYNLQSRNSLAQRQFQWVNDIKDKNIEPTPSRPSPDTKSNIIVFDSDSDSSPSPQPRKHSPKKEFNPTFADIDSSRAILSQCEDISNNIKKKHEEILATMQQIESNITNRLKIIQDTNNKISDNLKEVAENISQNNIPNVTVPLDNHIDDYVDDPVDNPIDDHVDLTNFIPIFINDKYTGRDNKTTLDDDILDMTLDLVGIFEGPAIIYPFGEKQIPIEFYESSFYMEYKDADDNRGTLFAIFEKNDNGIYVISIDHTLRTCTFPILITCRTQLIVP